MSGMDNKLTAVLPYLASLSLTLVLLLEVLSSMPSSTLSILFLKLYVVILMDAVEFVLDVVMLSPSAVDASLI